MMLHTKRILFVAFMVCLAHAGEETAERQVNYGAIGHIYGKRSQVVKDDALGVISRQYLTIKEFVELVRNDVSFATLAAKTIDRNGDGYVQFTYPDSDVIMSM